MYYQDGIIHITWADKPLTFILNYPGYCIVTLMIIGFLVAWRKR